MEPIQRSIFFFIKNNIQILQPHFKERKKLYIPFYNLEWSNKLIFNQITKKNKNSKTKNDHNNLENKLFFQEQKNNIV